LLLPLGAHPIGCFEIRASVGDESAVARMVNGFDPCDDLYQLWSVGMDVLHEFGLGIRGPGNEDCTRVSYRGGHVLKEFLIFRRVSTADRARLVMDVPRRLMGMQDQAINGCQIEMKYAGFVVINPDNRVVMAAHRVTPV